MGGHLNLKRPQLSFIALLASGYTGYCNPELDEMFDQLSMEPDQQKRKKLVWEIERRLASDGAQPIIFYPRAATCWHLYVKGLTIMINSAYNGWRMEDVWLDK